jgi:hypothetical protein
VVTDFAEAEGTDGQTDLNGSLKSTTPAGGCAGGVRETVRDIVGGVFPLSLRRRCLSQSLARFSILLDGRACHVRIRPPKFS